MIKIFLLAFVAAAANANDIDWTRVKPIMAYREFWRGKSFQPPGEFFNEGSYQQIGKFIINGDIAGRHDFPFKVALISEMSFGPSLCGASLISRWSVLTSGHCVFGSSSTVIILGGSDLNNPNERFQARITVQSTNYRIHPDFSEWFFRSDIAIVRFNAPIAMFHEAVNIVQLPTNDMVNNWFENVNAVVMGFGRYSDALPNNANILRFVEVTTISNVACSVRFPYQTDATHICAVGDGGRNFCGGDEGAPLVINQNGEYMQIAVASFHSTAGCGTSLPAVYTRITSFLPWIRQNMD